MTREQLDYEDLLRKYGNEYLQKINPDDCLYSMDEMDDLLNDSAYNAIQRAFYGYDYNPYRERDGMENEPFNPNRDYFGFNGYANLVSVDSRDYVQWMDDRIDEGGFIEWCIEQGYIDEEEIEGVGLVSALQPRYDSRASFYGKAQIDDHDDAITLYSYDKKVAEYNKASGNLHVYGYFSATTARHIREFAYQLGITLPSGKNIEGIYHY